MINEGNSAAYIFAVSASSVGCQYVATVKGCVEIWSFLLKYTHSQNIIEFG